MLKVSIVSLIYQSARLADWVHESVHRFTPMIARGEAEFFFVANDPTQGLLEHLRERGYPHVLNVNRRYADDELFALGYGAPEYISRVYRGYNEGIRAAAGDYVVLINSDNAFSPDWLENLLKYTDRSRVISSTLVERDHPVFSVFPGAVHGEFGDSPDTYDEAEFLAFAGRIRKTGLKPAAPTCRPSSIGTSPSRRGCTHAGNIAGTRYDDVTKYGDEAFFEVLEVPGSRPLHRTRLDRLPSKGGRTRRLPGRSGRRRDARASRRARRHAHHTVSPIAGRDPRDRQHEPIEAA